METIATKLADCTALINKGFETKAAKQAAKESLNRIWSRFSREAYTEGMRQELPMYAHQVSQRVVSLFEGFAELLEVAAWVRELHSKIKATEIVKVAKKFDNSKMRDNSPREATIEGIDFLDWEGTRRGYCYCCGRVGFVLKHGRLSRHGYTRPGYGYDLGGCSGSKRTPAATLQLAIAFHGKAIARLDTLLATDLIDFAIQDVRRLARAKDNTKRLRWNFANVLRSLRNGTSNRPATYRGHMTRQLRDHTIALVELEEVAESLTK